MVKMSEEAGIQFFGPDNVAIQRVRFIIMTTSGLLSLILIQEPGNFKQAFYLREDYKKVNIILNDL